METFIPVSSIYKDKKNVLTVYNDTKHFGYYNNLDDNKHTKAILESKRPNIAEVELTLFENCDINCSFCHHDKKSIVGMQLHEMLAKLDIIEKFFKDRQGTVDFMQINIVGGELFQDSLIDEYVGYYIDIAVELQILANRYNYNLHIVWVSNFLFSNYIEIHNLMVTLKLADIKSSLIVSYDFDGRPTNKTYYKNIEALESFISSVNIVATKETITEMMVDRDAFFAYIYDTFPVYVDDYIPDNISVNQTPPDTMMLTFYKFIFKKYPKIINIHELVENESNPMGCLSLNKITIFPDDSVSNCKWQRYKPENFETYKDKEAVEYQDNAPQMQRHLEHFNCLSCEFYRRCKFRCYTQWDFVSPDIHDYDGCWIKTFFRYLDEHA